jgi:dolichol kinase
MKPQLLPDNPPGTRIYRRLFHVAAASALPLIALLLSERVALLMAAAATVLLALWEAGRLTSPAVNRWFWRRLRVLFKPGEELRLTAATYLAAASLATLALFDSPVAPLALLYVALGDPVAALVGSRYGRRRLFVRTPWATQRYRVKTLEGSLAFLAVALAVAVLLWGAGLYTRFGLAALGALVAAVVELLPIPVDDNASVPLASAAAMSLLGLG